MRKKKGSAGNVLENKGSAGDAFKEKKRKKKKRSLQGMC